MGRGHARAGGEQRDARRWQRDAGGETRDLVVQKVDHLLFVEEPHLLLRWMDVHVQVRRRKGQREIDEGACTLVRAGCQHVCEVAERQQAQPKHRARPGADLWKVALINALETAANRRAFD